MSDVKPDWSKAPEWANYWAVDEDGNSYWYEEKPHVRYDHRQWNIEEGEQAYDEWYDHESWSESLKERPQYLKSPTVEVTLTKPLEEVSIDYKLPDNIFGYTADEFESDPSKSDGSSADYYELPEGCTQLQHLISYRNLNAQDGEMFRAIYRKGRASHSDDLRDAKKVLFYAQAEVERLEALQQED